MRNPTVKSLSKLKVFEAFISSEQCDNSQMGGLDK